MTCFNCNNCGRYKNICDLGEFTMKFKLGKLIITKEIYLCKWCLTKAGIKYYMDNGFLELKEAKSK